MDADRAEQITAGLARRLAAIIPDGFHLELADGILWFSGDDGRFPGQLGDYDLGRGASRVRDNLMLPGRTDEDRIVGMGRQALDDLQDFVSEASHDPWPGERAQPEAHARLRDRMLYLWYGGPDPGRDAVLAVEPLPIGDLGD